MMKRVFFFLLLGVMYWGHLAEASMVSFGSMRDYSTPSVTLHDLIKISAQSATRAIRGLRQKKDKTSIYFMWAAYMREIEITLDQDLADGFINHKLYGAAMKRLGQEYQKAAKAIKKLGGIATAKRWMSVGRNMISKARVKKAASPRSSGFFRSFQRTKSYGTDYGSVGSSFASPRSVSPTSPTSRMRSYNTYDSGRSSFAASTRSSGTSSLGDEDFLKNYNNNFW